MQVDKITLTDLSMLHNEEEQSVFHVLNHTQTNGGRAYLRHLLQHPLPNIDQINDVQNTIKVLFGMYEKWPTTITNGTVMVIETYYDTSMDAIPAHTTVLGALYYKYVNRTDFSLIKYTVEHTIVFFKGMQSIAEQLRHANGYQIQSWYSIIDQLLKRPFVQEMLQLNAKDSLSVKQIIFFGHQLRHHFKSQILELIDVFSMMDAYLSVGIAAQKLGLMYPAFTKTQQPQLHIQQLFHPQIQLPTAYDVALDVNHNFLFLTGANMAGKSTFIKAVGIAVYLAHVGMPVPAKNMHLSYFDGLLSNIQVADNVVKGQSFFYNEVHRIKNTITKISDGKNWLILIDELFKGTNVQDAMKCSTTVIEGLINIPNALYIVSTHLYEIGYALQQYPNIQFRYFETHIQNEQLVFSYQLKEGISNDRLGYLILKREGVVDLLQKLSAKA